MKNQTAIYLDYNATAPVRPEVAQAVAQAMQLPSNPSSVHGFGRAAHKIVEDARASVRTLVGASDAYHIIFTSSGTEANNLALQGFGKQVVRIVSAVEHASVLKAYGQSIVCPVDEKGIIRLDALRRLLEDNAGSKALVSVQLANNETGILQPIQEVAQLVYAHGGYVHCDTVQGFGKLPVDIQALNVDMLTVSAHKFGGALGAAALVVKKGVPLQAVTFGGGQEFGFRAGTENVPAIAGFGVAAALASQQVTAMAKIAALRDALEAEILSAASDAAIIGRDVARLPNTSSISMPGMHNETQLIAFDLENIAVSAGSACSSGKVEVSHVLRAMGVPAETASSVIRVSIGANTTENDVAAFIAAWKKIYTKANNKKPKAA
jgi:cysteine desulfurase